MISDKVIKIEINDKGVFIDDVKVEGENSLYTFEFENAPIDTPKKQEMIVKQLSMLEY